MYPLGRFSSSIFLSRAAAYKSAWKEVEMKCGRWIEQRVGLISYYSGVKDLERLGLESTAWLVTNQEAYGRVGTERVSLKA